MSYIASEKRKNRNKQSGAPYPEAKLTITSLARIFKNLNRRHLPIQKREKFFFVFISLWLTGELAALRKQDNSAKISDYTLPDLFRQPAYKACRQHAFRTVMHESTSWVEYAVAYPVKNDIVYLWQPVPSRLNPFFQRFVSQRDYERPFLNPREKGELKTMIERRWKQHGLDDLERSVGRKDNLINYFNICVQNDNGLSALPRHVLSHQHHRVHHDHARSYQQETSDRLRAKIFRAHERYLERLVFEIRALHFEEKFTVERRTKNRSETESVYFVDTTLLHTVPLALTAQTIRQLQYREGESKPSSAHSPVLIGSQRSVDVVILASLFRQLENDIHSCAIAIQEDNALEAFIAYYNLCTYHLTLCFLICTGVRPTHHISIESARYFPGKKATVRDKGRYREILICDYLAEQIHQHQRLQKRLTSLLPAHALDLKKDVLWYLIDDNHKAHCVSACLLRQFLKQKGATFVAYSIRHAFAQYALEHVYPSSLSNAQIDRLMGHANIGENLGNDHVFPLHRQQLLQHVNSIAPNFNLQKVRYVR
ncbi:hypothetical protein [Vibrio methylphosphonaticus]|uniref:hypothetical protein n=1 Tax=Vibrio methylphosphonaticus TaxID=2946866 RepID=UPI002029FC56|nr:hypothetical protein [Vibrio methylphosphonaticus]MCL9775497.1 hypothetical protein [Vibrio methylphosphonaticus]